MTYPPGPRAPPLLHRLIPRDQPSRRNPSMCPKHPRSHQPPPRSRPRTMRPSAVQCPCGKVYSPTKNDARINRMAYGNAAGALNPVRFYQCDYGGWHWTSDVSRSGR